MPAPPKKLIVVGAGVIGLELGSVWRRLGAEVTVVEFLDRILPGMDGEVAKQFQRMLEKQGFAFHLGHKVDEGRKGGGGRQGDDRACGRRRGQDDRGRRRAGRDRPAALSPKALAWRRSASRLDRGQVVVDAHFATNVPGIYAIGDVIRGPMLAHKAEDEGVALAELLAGQAGHVNYGVIPSVVYTSPEIASVGKTEEELKAEGVAYAVGKFPFTANGRARAMRHTDGFVKILADAATRPRARRAYRGLRRRRDDPRGGGADGVRRLGGGPRPHLPRPSDDVGSGQGGGDGGGRSARSIFELATVLRA